MSEKKKVPELRFPGFTGDWEQRKLGNLMETRRGLTYSPNDIRDSGVRVLRSSNIDEDRFSIHSDDVFVDDSAVNIPGVHNGDIIITSANGSSRLVGKHAVINGIQEKSAVHGGFMLVGTTRNPYFVNALMSASWYQKFISVYVAGGNGAIGNLNKNDLDEQIVMAPSELEQDRIGNFFKDIDNLITLHQRKHDEIAEYQTALIQKLFPANGASTPEKRFPQFTEPWKSCTLGELYTERNEKGNDALKILSVSIHSGVSDTELDEDSLGKQVRRSEDKSLYKHVYYGDLVFNMMRAWQGAIGVVKSEGMISPAYISAIPNEKVYPEFMDYCLRRKTVIDEINNLSYGVTDFRKRLYWDSFVKVRISLPSVDEQKRITEVLRKMDNMINLYQKKADILKDFKKAMLQRMFV